MKTKKKLIVLVEIAVVLCSVFLMALPAIAAEQTAQTITASSEDDYVLDVYGNANEDDTIDMRDLTYVKLIFFGKKPETELADAKYDGKINPLDFIQIKLIIVEKEKELTVVDSADAIVTVSMPIERAVVLNSDFAEAVAVLDKRDIVVGVTSTITKYTRFFPEISTKTDVGGWYTPDVEAILATEPDTIFTYVKYPSTAKLDDKISDTNINILRLDFYMVATQRDEMVKLGYLLNKKELADKYIEWHDGYVDEIYDRVAEISDEDKVKVFIDGGDAKSKMESQRRAYSTGTGMHDLCIYAGGINIAEGHVEGYADVETEWILTQAPDVIVGITYKGGYETDDNSLMKEQYDTINAISGFETSVPAVINDRVHIMSNAFAFSPHYPAPLAVMAKWLYPAKFEDFDPEAIHQEYIDKFLGIDYDAYTQGVFVYP